MNAITATTRRMCINPPPILSKNPNNQISITIPPSQRKNAISITTFHISLFFIIP